MIFESNQQNNAPFFKLHVGLNKYKRKWMSNFLGWKLINIWIGKCTLSLCIPNWTICAMRLDAWSIIAIRTIKMVHYAYFQSAVMYGIIFWGRQQQSIHQQKRTVETILGINPRSTWKPHFKTPRIMTGAWGGVVIKALCYLSDGHSIESRWCHWIFQWHIPSDCIMVLESTQPLVKMSTRNISWR
jgi:hypothetical protein